jgi:Amt family ammonium transporter
MRMRGLMAALAAVMMPAIAFAAEQPAKLDSGDTAWMLTSTAIVLLMTIPGIALLYGGMVRKKNILNTLMQSFAICCLVSALWMVAGYSLAFAEGGSFVGGLGKVFLSGLNTNLHG